MNQKMKDNIKLRWRITDAFTKALSTREDRSIWAQTCNRSDFRTSFSYYTNVEKTYLGMLENVEFFTSNCSVDGLLGYIRFYEGQTGVRWQELYQTNINTYTKRKSISRDGDTDWWEDHLAIFKKG